MASRLIKSVDVFGSTSVINVFDYLTSVQRTAVIARTGTDVTTAVASAIAAIPSTGGALYFPAGRYVTTGGFTIANPTRIYGDGSGKIDSTGVSITQIECNSTTAKLFTVTADNTFFEHLGLFQTGGTATSGSSLIYTNGSSLSQMVSYFDIVTDGGYDGIDIAVGNSWCITACDFLNAKHWGIRIRNTVNTDAGDWAISNTNIYPAANADACIRYESSGGGKIVNCKLIPNSGTVVNGLSMAISGATGQLLISNCSMEQFSAEPILINNSVTFTGVIITSNYLQTNSVSAAAINATNIGIFSIGNNILSGGGAVAVSLTNCGSGTLLTNTQSGFTANYSNTGTGSSSNIINWNANPLYLGGQASSNVAFYNSGTGGLGSKAQVTIATADDPTHTFANVIAHQYLTDTGIASGGLQTKDASFNDIFLNKNNGFAIAFNGTGSDYGGITAGNDVWALVSSTNGSSVDKTALQWTQPGSVAIGPTSALATNATGGFLYIPTCAGTPTGVPTTITGKVAMVYDTTNNKFYIYNGAWKGGTAPGVFS